MFRILAAAFALALLAPVSALAAPPPNITQTVGVCDPNYPKRCIAVAVDGSIAVTGGGSGGGGASATAASQGTVPVVAGTNKPVAIDLFSSTSVLVKDATGTPIDWTAPVPVTQSGTWTVQPGNTPNTVAWKVDGSAVTQPVSGTVTAAQVTAANLNAQVVGNVADNGADGTSPPVKVGGRYNSAVQTYQDGDRADVQMTADGYAKIALCVAASTSCAIIAGPTNDGNSVTTNRGLWVNSVPFLFNGASTDRGRSITDTTGSQAGTGVAAVAMAPTSAAGQAIAINATTAVASSLILKAAAGNGYRYALTTGASAGYLMVFDAVSAPADGAVTPKICRAVAANSSLEVAHTTLPDRFSTGITLVFSLTGCYTKTASATAALEGQVQ